MAHLWDNVVAVVLGGSNTDLISTGATKPAGPGEMIGAARFTIGPGGKSRNVAQMMGAYLGPGRVSFVGRTLAPHGDFASLDALFARPEASADILPQVYSLLAQVPLAALRRSGVLTDLVRLVPYAGTAGGVAQIVVLSSGENMIYSMAGVNAEFSPEDVASAAPLMEAVGRRGGGVLPMALEIPFDTAVAGAELARRCGLTVIVDPGGMTKGRELSRGQKSTLGDVLKLAHIVKPNEQEAMLLTGVEVSDTASAARAAEVLAARDGVAEVIITAGARGAWHWKDGRIALQKAYSAGPTVDTTGCGDQFMAVLSAHAASGGDRQEGLDRAMVAAALQATRLGIQPVARAEVEEHLARYRREG